MDRLSILIPIGLVALAAAFLHPQGHASGAVGVAVTAGVAILVLGLIVGAESLARRFGSNR